MNGGLGRDHLEGGKGNDVYVVDSADEITKGLGDAGIDRVVSSVTYGLGEHQERLVLSGAGNNNGAGNSGDNIVSGNRGNNHLSGGAGDDVLNGEAGDDRLNGGAGDDSLRGGSGADQLHGAAGNDRLYYDADDSRIDGGAGDDTLIISGSGVNLDLSSVAGSLVTGIEELNLTGSGNNSITLSADDVLAMSPTSNIVMLTGNAGDSVISSGWVLDVGESEVEHGHTYNTYTSGLATLLVDDQMTQAIV